MDQGNWPISNHGKLLMSHLGQWAQSNPGKEDGVALLESPSELKREEEVEMVWEELTLFEEGSLFVYQVDVFDYFRTLVRRYREASPSFWERLKGSLPFQATKKLGVILSSFETEKGGAKPRRIVTLKRGNR